MKKVILSLTVTILATISSRADSVDWSMIGGYIYTDNSFSTIVPDGTLVRFGTFGPGYNFTGKTYSDLVADFTVWDTDTTGVPPLPSGQFYKPNAVTANVPGTPWYIFVGSSPSSFGVFGSPIWVDSGMIWPQYADLTDPGVFVAGGFGYISGTDVALIPEPSTCALLAGSLTMLVIFRKCRKVC